MTVGLQVAGTQEPSLLLMGKVVHDYVLDAKTGWAFESTCASGHPEAHTGWGLPQTMCPAFLAAGCGHMTESSRTECEDNRMTCTTSILFT